MSLFEGVGLGSDKQTVVIDIGCSYTKVGFAGESGPRCIIPTEVILDSNIKKKVYDHRTNEELYNLLVQFLHNIYFRYLLVSPKDRRIVIVESLLCPTQFRETLAKVLFRHFEVISVLFVPSHLVALCTLGINTALILDVGYQEAVLFPVFEGVPVLHAWQAQPLAGQAVDRKLRSLLEEDNKTSGLGLELSSPLDISDSIVEDIKVRTCFVTSLKRIQSREEGLTVDSPPKVEYQYKDKIILVSGSTREMAHELLFEQDGDQMSVATMILDAILKCPIDMRKPLAENLVLIGGTAMTLGFKSRLLEEIKHLLTTSKYSSKLVLKTFKFHTAPAKENYVAWLGGAIFGGTDALLTRSLTKEMYLKTNNVPDWVSLTYNKREEENVCL